MAEAMPIFALDLSNDGIALWHRSGGSGWISLGHMPLDAKDMPARIQMMRAKAGITHNKPLKTVIRIPRSEVMISRLKLGVFEGEAAVSQARKLITELTPYKIQEVVYDLDAKGVGNMAPVAIAARKTLEEAQEFAAQHGFTVMYFTTQVEPRDFPHEPRFYLTPPRKPILPLFSRIAAATAIGLTAGYFGYVTFLTPTPVPVAPVTQVAPAVQPVPEVVVQVPTVPDVDTSLPPDFSAPQTATLIAPQTTSYPQILFGDVGRTSITRLYRLARPINQHGSAKPKYAAVSLNHKTDALALADALRDLPDLALDDDVLAAQLAEMALTQVAEHVAEQPLVVAAYTPPTTAYGEMVSSLLVEPVSGYVVPPQNARQPADPPPPPPAPIIAEPGTLTPTPEGTLGPENILIFSGKPPVLSRARPVIVAPADPLAGFRPRPRPEGLVSAELLAQLAVQAVPQTVEQPDQLAALTTDEQAPASPAGEASAAPDSVPQIPDLPLAVQPDTTTAPVGQTAQIPDLSLLTLADPALAGVKARPRPAEFAPQIPVVIPEQPTTILSLADPTLAGFKAKARPSNLAVAPQQPTSLLALADPALVGKKPRSRPAGLSTVVVVPVPSLLALADPKLSGFRAKRRPRNLKAIKPKVEEPVTEPVTKPITNTLASATRLAIAKSPKPKRRPKNLAKRTSVISGGTTKATGSTPKSAKGSSKPSPGQTSTTVAKAATEKSRFNKRKMNLVGVFGTPNARRALVRLPSGRYVKVKAGDRLSGWKVSAIGESSLRIVKGSKNQVLRMP